MRGQRAPNPVAPERKIVNGNVKVIARDTATARAQINRLATVTRKHVLVSKDFIFLERIVKAFTSGGGGGGHIKMTGVIRNLENNQPRTPQGAFPLGREKRPGDEVGK